MLKVKMRTKREHIINEHICRLCLKVAEDKFEIDEIVRQIFDILFIKLDLGITRGAIICEDCLEVAKKCLNFKYTCITTEEIIFSCCADGKGIKDNIKDIYEERKNVMTVFDDDFNVCRFCMTRVERNNFASLGALMNETTFEMLPEYMTEMDFNTVEDPLVCGNCRENLGDYFKFVLNCVDTEEKIKAYCKVNGSENAGEVKLGNVLQFILTDFLEHPNKCSQTCKIKQDHIEYIYPEAYIGLIKQDELDIKEEEMILHEDSYRNISVDIGVSPMFHKCSLCSFKSKYKHNLKTHMLVHKDVPKLKMFKCSLCSYEARQKGHIKSHMLLHNDVSELKMYKCALCAHETKRKADLERHILDHKDVSEIKMYKCALCAYEAKRKIDLERHMLVHKDVSEIKTFKCSLCSFETKHKGSLKPHMLVHKDVSEIKMYKCSSCAYESKHKSSLRSHLLIHKDVSEIQTFKCSLCAKEYKYKSSLESHMLVHKDISEITMFKCSLCSFESKRKSALRRHMLVHRDVSEIHFFKCSLCTHKSKRKEDLNSHMKVHHMRFQK